MGADQIVAALVNAGGLGLLAAVLFVLHREALKTFRDEIGEERRANTENLRLEREQCHEDHMRMEQSLAAVRADVAGVARAVDRLEPRRGTP